MRRPSLRAVLCQVCLVFAGCGGVDVYGAFLPHGADAGPHRTAADAAVPVSVMIADASDSSSDPDPSARTNMPQSSDGRSGTPSIQSDAGSADGMHAPPVNDESSLCLRAGGDAKACEAARTAAFGHAVCSCSGLLGTGSMSTETLNGTRRADVGTNNAFTLRISRRTPPNDAVGLIDGALVIAGIGPSAVSGANADIRGNLMLGGELGFAGDVHVLGSVFSRAMPRGNGSLRIDGDLHYAAPLNRVLAPNVMVQGQLIADDYVSMPACGCGASSASAIMAALNAAASSNDDALVQLGPEALGNLTTSRSLSLGCGSYYFRSVTSLGSLALQITGHAVIAVSGDFAVRGDVTVNLPAGAELDLIVGGNLLLSGAARFGDPERPGAARIYVRGGVELTTNGDPPGLTRPSSAVGEAVFVGNLFAPTASLELAPHSDVYGSLFVNQLVVLQSLFVHYDPSVISEHGASCGN